MNAIRNLWNAFANLSASINALAGVVDAASGRLRQQLALDGEAAPVLDHQPAGNTDGDSAVSNGAAKGRKVRAGV